MQWWLPAGGTCRLMGHFGNVQLDASAQGLTGPSLSGAMLSRFWGGAARGEEVGGGGGPAATR